MYILDTRKCNQLQILASRSFHEVECKKSLTTFSQGNRNTNQAYHSEEEVSVTERIVALDKTKLGVWECCCLSRQLCQTAISWVDFTGNRTLFFPILESGSPKSSFHQVQCLLKIPQTLVFWVSLYGRKCMTLHCPLL